MCKSNSERYDLDPLREEKENVPQEESEGLKSTKNVSCMPEKVCYTRSWMILKD